MAEKNESGYILGAKEGFKKAGKEILETGRKLGEAVQKAHDPAVKQEAGKKILKAAGEIGEIVAPNTGKAIRQLIDKDGKPIGKPEEIELKKSSKEEMFGSPAGEAAEEQAQEQLKRKMNLFDIAREARL